MSDRDESRGFGAGAISDDVMWRRIVERAARDLDPEHPRNARYFEWLAMELRRRETPEGRARNDARAAAWCERHFASRAHDWFRVRFTNEEPRLRQPDVPRPVLAALTPAVRRALGRAAPMVNGGAAAGTGRDIMDELVTEYIELPPELPSGRYLALWVAGTSMAPLLHDGDRICVELEVPPAVDTVVVARAGDSGWVVKRVRHVDENLLVLDALNPEFEPLVLRRAETEVLGRVVLRWCSHDM